MKKFWLSILFELLLMVELAAVIFTMEVQIDSQNGMFSLEIPYGLIIAIAIFITIIINYYVYSKIKVANIMDAPLIIKSHDEREQAIINKYAVLGFAYITPIVVICGAVFIALSVAFVSDIVVLLKIIGYAIILFVGLPFIIHTLLVIREIKKV
ncbi:MAG: hypothetical protein ACLFRI_05300 [Candidatus Izemoplasmataceae bacterium]